MKEYECEFCVEDFTNSKQLIEHKSNSKYCNFYKNIEFVCKKCNFKTIGIKNIDKHIYECEGLSKNILENNSDILSRIELKLDKLLDNKIKKAKINKKIIIDDDDNEYTIEDEIIKKSVDNKKHHYKSPRKNLSPVNNISPEIISPKNRKPIYKSFKTQIGLKPELSNEDKENNINIIKENLKEFENDLEIKQYKKIFEDSFSNIKQNRNYSKYLEIIKNTRILLLNSLGYNEYYDLLLKHVKTLESIFKNKEYNDKKILNIICKNMCSIDLRILNYGNYFSTELDIDEMQKFSNCLNLNNNFEPEFKAFIFDDFIKKFYNYGSVLFTIKENLERYLFSHYGYNNIVYIPLKNSTENDPWSFYILESVNKEKRYWKMDCRLEDLSINILTNLRQYLVSVFRKIYSDIYHDNQYRKLYKTNCITELDCEQLLQNIFMLINHKDFCSFLRDIVKKNATYFPTENDKGDFLGDDKLQKKRFMENNEKYDIFDVIKLLFDNISSEEAIDFYRKDN